MCRSIIADDVNRLLIIGNVFEVVFDAGVTIRCAMSPPALEERYTVCI